MLKFPKCQAKCFSIENDEKSRSSTNKTPIRVLLKKIHKVCYLKGLIQRGLEVIIEKEN